MKCNFFRVVFLCLVFVVCSHEVLAAGSKRAFVDTPTMCNKLDHVEDGKVYLESPDHDCEFHGSGKLSLAIEDDLKSLDVYVDGKFWKSESVVTVDADVDAVNNVSDKAHLSASDLVVPQNQFADFGKTKAQEMVNFYNSPEYQNKIKIETERLKKEVFSKQFVQPAGKGQGNAANPLPGKLPADERFYIFISSSMPVQVIRNYMADAGKLGDPNVVFVLRGFLGGATHVKPTEGYVASLLKINPDCGKSSGGCGIFNVALQIDPALFTRYGVHEVPTFIYARNINNADRDRSEGETTSTTVGSYKAISGDRPLEYILEKLYEATGSKPLELEIAALKRTFYDGSPPGDDPK